MKLPLTKSLAKRGGSLVEVIIAMGVLAVAVPIVFGALAESGRSGMASEAETRSTWIVPACMDEIRASRDGKPVYFTTTTIGQIFPNAGEVWALGFSAEGKPVAKLGSKAIYDKGLKDINGQRVSYIASLSATKITVTTGAPAMVRVKISMEFPASAPAAKRQKLDFYSRIP